MLSAGVQTLFPSNVSVPQNTPHSPFRNVEPVGQHVDGLCFLVQRVLNLHFCKFPQNGEPLDFGRRYQILVYQKGDEMAVRFINAMFITPFPITFVQVLLEFVKYMFACSSHDVLRL